MEKKNDNMTAAMEWLSFARQDYNAAKHLHDTFHPEPLEIICYHCQQAAEKAVKALIVLYGAQGGFPKKHDLFLLLNQIKNMTSIEEKYYDYADILTPYGIAVRYPHELFLEKRHAEQALKMAKEYLDWTESQLEFAGEE